MTGAQWASVRRLLDEALDNPKDRPSLLAKLRDEDPEICDQLERLLTDFESEDELGEEAPAAPGLAGQTIGPYTIVRELGRGGSGTVVLAEHEEAGARVEVALKFLRSDFFRGAPRRAFHRELRALARLDHPHIARLLDWCILPGGMMYLAIEYVDGQSIAEYCSRKRLGLMERLALFEQVCEAVEHAHRNLVVHRDLKPSNIFVTGDGKVKLLDFGIAAELDSTVEPTTLLRRASTPAYASPEQIEGHPVSVATDVYSLGLVLYELLTGRLPHSKDAHRFWATVDQEPPPPSKRATLPEIAAREIAGDVDFIVMKAIHKEPERRYLSVEQFASDIRRCREGRPVLARRGSRLYIAGRFLRRNRLNVAAASLAVLALTSTAGVAFWKWRAADRNLAEAQRDYRLLRAFAQGVIANIDAQTMASPTEAQRRMSETVAQHLHLLSQGRQHDEELELQIAGAYLQLGLAQGQIAHPNQGDPNAALVNFQEAYRISLEQWRSKGSRNSGLHLLHAAMEIGFTLPDPDPAATLLSSAIGAAQGLVARYPKDREVQSLFSGAYGTLGQRVRSTGDLQAAIENFQASIGFADRALAIQPNDPSALSRKEGYMSELGVTLRMEGRLQEALAAQMGACQIAKRAVQLQPSNHTRREEAFKLMARSDTLLKLKRDPESLDDVREAITKLLAISAQDPADDQAKADVSMAYFRLGNVEFFQHRLADALRSHREALRRREEQRSRHSSNFTASRSYQSSLIRTGEILLATHQEAQADGNFDDALALGNELMKRAPSDVNAAVELAKIYRGKATSALRGGRRTEAAELFRRSLGMWRDAGMRAPLDVDVSAAARDCERTLAHLENRAAQP